jgi:hypothetical protein
MIEYFFKKKGKENLEKWEGLVRLIALKPTSFGGDTFTYVVENTGKIIYSGNVNPINHPPISVYYKKENVFPIETECIPEEANALLIGKRYKLKKIPEEFASASYCRVKNIKNEVMKKGEAKKK